MRKPIIILIALAISITACKTDVTLINKGDLSMICQAQEGKLYSRKISKTYWSGSTTEILCMKNNGTGATFSYIKPLTYGVWVELKAFTNDCLINERAYFYFQFSSQLPLLTTKLSDEYKRYMYKKCKVDLSIATYESEKKVLDAISAPDISERKKKVD